MQIGMLGLALMGGLRENQTTDAVPKSPGVIQLGV